MSRPPSSCEYHPACTSWHGGVHTKPRVVALRDLSRQIRLVILEQAHRAHVGHIGSALSVSDIVAALYGAILDPQATNDPDRDRFILSKGHAALAVYAALCQLGYIDRTRLETYCADGSLLGVHPQHQIPGIDFATGSLGHGLSYGAGAALAGRLLGSSRKAIVLLSDAECSEGSTWEAIMFAAHHRLSRLVAIVDLNGQQALGYTQDVLDLQPMAERWGAFGWDVHEVDGHDAAEIANLITSLAPGSGPPHVLLARTVFGKGVSFMERQIRWHYLPMSDVEFATARREVELMP